MVYHALVSRSEVLGTTSVGASSRNDKSERVKNEQDRLLEEVIPYKREKNIVMKLLEKGAVMIAMTRSVVVFEITLNHLGSERGLLMNTNEELVFCSSRMTTSDNQITEKLMKLVAPV